MDNAPGITLTCVQRTGQRDTTTLIHHTLPLAREVAKWVLQAANGRYTEIDIVTESGHVETLQDTVVPAPGDTPEVLLVEDNAGDALLIGQALEQYHIPVHLHIARDGQQAMQILGERDFHPDLIILDLNIPRISGHTLLSLYHPKNTPVVVFTASENEADVNRALSLGADEYIHKPMELDDYKTTVCGIVRKWAPRVEGTPPAVS